MRKRRGNNKREGEGGEESKTERQAEESYKRNIAGKKKGRRKE